MTEPTTTSSAAADKQPSTSRKRGAALGGKVLAELQEIAAELGLTGTAKMRKGELIDAIKAARGDAPKTAPASKEPLSQTPTTQTAPTQGDAAPTAPAEAPTTTPDPGPSESEQTAPEQGRRRNRSKDRQEDDAPTAPAGQQKSQRGEEPQESTRPSRAKDNGGDDTRQQNRGGRGDNDGNGSRSGGQRSDNGRSDNGRSDNGRGGNNNANDQRGGRDGDQRNGNEQRGNQSGRSNDQPARGNNNGNATNGPSDDDDNGRRRNRRGRGRTNRGADGEPTYAEDDVLVPAAGILDILDNYAFVRTTGYLPSENDVYVSLSMVRKLGLRRGDAVVGQVRQPREGERKEKFNPMVRVDGINGVASDEARERVAFADLTPVFPTERLQLETGAEETTTRVIDLVAPLGKGQRGLVLSPPKAGKTTTLRAVAEAISTNNPECHLMVVLVDERPEEVTEMQRSVKGEVIASTFDRQASDHTTVAELAIERAKRLVELGHDVVVLLDSLTRLGRAYNQAAPTSSRGLPGGVDPSALHPAKRFFGAARATEGSGSLTILATALVGTGSATDEAILEEFGGTANSELVLRRDLASRRVFPAIDVAASGTAREDLLVSGEELSVVGRLRRAAADLDAEQALELVLGPARSSADGADLLRQLSAALPRG